MLLEIYLPEGFKHTYAPLTTQSLPSKKVLYQLKAVCLILDG